MYPLDLSPNANLSVVKSYSKDVMIINDTTLRKKDNNKTAAMCSFINKSEKDQGKRGRPRADILTSLMVEGSSSRSRIRCNKCGRVFPREKSLQAHLRTHTGERPYTCDFPGCTKAFCQSGQLKTHQRLHTGEKPFVCNVEGCNSRFTHANRHCSVHPNAGLRRAEVNLLHVAQQLRQDAKSFPEKEWLERYIRKCQDRVNIKDPNPKPINPGPLDMRKRVIGLRYSGKRRGSSSSTSSISSSDSGNTSSGSSTQETPRRKIQVAPLPPIPPFPVTPPHQLSPVPFSMSPPLAHQSSVTLTPVTPRHPGVEQTTDISKSPTFSSPTSLLSSSPSPSSAVRELSSAVRDLSSFKPIPPKPVPYRYLTKNLVSQPTQKPSYDPSKSCSPIFVSQSVSFYNNSQALASSPSFALTPAHSHRGIDYKHMPYKNDKDKYLSALALIELSKG